MRRARATGRGRRPGVAGVAVALVTAFPAALLAMLATSPRPGVSVDSAQYLAAAEAAVSGDGLWLPYASYGEPYPSNPRPGTRVPLTHFPPLYPGLIAAVIGVTGSTALVAARWLSVAVYASIAALAGGALRAATGSAALGIAGGLLLLAPDLVTVHAMAWSEPLLNLFFLGAALSLHRFLQSPSRARLIATVALVASASVTRYVGAVAAIACAAVIARYRPPGRRWGEAAAALAGGLAPLGAWLVRNALLRGPAEASARSLAWHPPTASDLRRLVVVAGEWLLSGDPTPVALAVSLAGVALLLPIGPRSRPAAGSEAVAAPAPSEAAPRLESICAVFALVYAAGLLASRALLDAHISFRPRHLSPLHVLAVVGGLCALARWGRVGRARLAAGALLLAALALVRSVPVAAGFSERVIAGYTGPRLETSPTLAYVGGLPPSTVVVTNAPDLIWFRHRRSSVFMPLRIDLTAGRANPDYRREVAAVAAALRGRDALVVFFSRPTGVGAHHQIPPRLARLLDLGPLESLEDGAVFRIGPSAASEPPAQMAG